jgi:hypothetical protein
MIARRRDSRRALLALVLTLGAAAAPSGAQNITYSSFDWHVYHSPHFDLHYYPEIEPFLEELVSYVESAYLELSRELDHELRFRVPVVLYKTHGEFQQTNIQLSEVDEGVGAFAEPLQNRVVLPIDLPPDKLYQLISHELTHIFEFSFLFEGYLSRTLRSSPPTWLMEGLASYLGRDEDNLDRMVIRDAVVNNVLPPIESLQNVTFLTYRYGHAIFDFIEQEQGKEGLRTFLFEYRKALLSNNVEKAVKDAFGYDMATFDRRFNQFLRKKYFPALLERKSPDDYGKEIGVKRPGVVTFSPHLSPSGELVAVLASPTGLELDLLVLSARDGKKIKNLTKGWTNHWRHLVTNVFDGKRDLSWSPTADQIAVFARRESRWPLLIFDAVRGKRIREIGFDDIVECASPTFSPDGRRIAFEGNRQGIVDLFEVDLETREVRNLTRDEFFDANPWYAPDGKTLLYNRRIGSHWKIFSVDLADAERKTALTFGASNDIQPSYSRDGQRIYFSSDRGGEGVFNLHELDLSSGDMLQHTDVVGGCFAPLEVGGPAGERGLVHTTYFAGAFRLYRMDLGAGERRTSGAERAAEPTEATPFAPPLNLRLDEAQKAPYKLRWDVEAPSVSVGVTDDGTFLSNGAIQFSDLMGDHRVQIVASTVAEFSNLHVIYANLKRRFDWGATAFDQRDYFLESTSSGLNRDLVNRQTGASMFIEYPFNRHYRVEAAAGVVDTAQDLLAQVGQTPQGGPVYDFRQFSDRFATLSLAFAGDTARGQSFGPFQGKRFEIGTIFAPHISGDFDGDLIEHRLDFRAYKQVTRRSVLAWRLASLYNVGERENAYGFGGLNQLRGFEFRDFNGSRLAWSNLEFRFPLVDELRFPVLQLVEIRGLFFLDVGSAWYQNDLFYDPEFATPLSGVEGGIRQDLAGNPEPWKFWDSENDRLQDGRASYGAGFQFRFIGGLQFNWTWARRFDYTRFVFDSNLALVPVKAHNPGSRMEFYIAFDY